MLTRLREGSSEAYAQLWCRYIGLALTVARRYAPGAAEDLASEAFLAVYRQVAVEGKGPREAFRPYLLTTMRNLAIRWSKAGRLVDTDPDIDETDAVDPLTILSDEAEAGELLAAFQDLPERWQRVLWLAEVEDVPRARIAAELGIKPNAVSALTRRARNGLGLQWLTRRVPARLASDPLHAAALLPAYVAAPSEVSAADRNRIEGHLAGCGVCAELHDELRAGFARTRRATLGAAGFAALAGVIPASAAGSGGAAGAAALLVGGVVAGSMGSTGVAAGIGVIAVAGVLATALFFSGGASGAADGKPSETGSASVPGNSDGSTSGFPSGTGTDTNGGSGTGGGSSASAGGNGQQPNGEFGRGVQDPTIVAADFDPSGQPGEYLPPPPQPQPAQPGTVSGPTDGQPGGDPGGGPNQMLLTSGAEPIPEQQRYIAPQLSGRATPGSTVAVEYRYLDSYTTPTARIYTVAPDAAGAWSFDFRSLGNGRSGTHEYRVWAFTETDSSAAITGTFTIESPLITGVEFATTIPLEEASQTGLVFQVTGAPGTTVCMTTAAAEQWYEIPLDGSGKAVRRMRMHAYGFYYLYLEQCDRASATEMYRGAPAELAVDVYDDGAPIFTPWDPGLESIDLEPVD
nr:sigma-70 family RNA polymerase sigma factor [Leucobacter ruminantium]